MLRGGKETTRKISKNLHRKAFTQQYKSSSLCSIPFIHNHVPLSLFSVSFSFSLCSFPRALFQEVQTNLSFIYNTSGAKPQMIPRPTAEMTRVVGKPNLKCLTKVSSPVVFNSATMILAADPIRVRLPAIVETHDSTIQAIAACVLVDRFHH